MLKGLSKTWSLITLLAIIITGCLSTMYLIRDYNIQSDIFGTPTKEQTSYKIDDFNFQINNLMFSETGIEHEYIATATTLPITNFDKTSKYTLLVNDTLCNRTSGNYDYVQSTFNNNFKDIKNNVLYEGEMLITIVPYKDYTKLTFMVTGDNSTNYWNQYIVNYGLKLTIIEFNYSSNIQADNVSLVKYYLNDELYKVEACEINTEYTLMQPEFNDEIYFTGWNENQVTINGIELQNITEYQPTEKETKNFYGYMFQNHTLTIDYDNKTESPIRLHIANISKLTSGGNVSHSINKIYSTDILKVGTGSFTFDNSTDYANMAILLNEGECLSKVTYFGYTLYKNTLCLHHSEYICTDSHCAEEFCNASHFNFVSLITTPTNNQHYYFKLTIE